MASVSYTWDVPYSDFTNNLKVTVYNSSGSEITEVTHKISDGNITLNLPGYGSYRLVALDNGIRYTKNVSINSPVSSATVGIDYSVLDRYLLKNDKQFISEVAKQSIDKELIAKILGYYEIVSDIEPDTTFYTTKDGVKLPVVWNKPIKKVVPVFPQNPEWNDYTQSVMVPKLVGLVYKLSSGEVITPNEWYRIEGTPPFSVRVVVEPSDGYTIPSSSSWEHTFPSTEQYRMFTSDTFDRADAPYSLIGSTDAINGGTSILWDKTFNGVIPSTASEKLLHISDGKLVFEPYSIVSDTEVKGWIGTRLKNVPENWKLSMELSEYQNVIHGQALSVAVYGYGSNKSTVTISWYVNGPTKYLQASWFDATTNKYVTENVLDGVPTGEYVIEKQNTTLKVKSPEKERSISLTGHEPSASVSPELRIMRALNTASSLDKQRVVIDNFKLYSIGF